MLHWRSHHIVKVLSQPGATEKNIHMLSLGLQDCEPGIVTTQRQLSGSFIPVRISLNHVSEKKM
jgi:hypothetical protein